MPHDHAWKSGDEAIETIHPCQNDLSLLASVLVITQMPRAQPGDACLPNEHCPSIFHACTFVIYYESVMHKQGSQII
jgi:hypothetical protein